MDESFLQSSHTGGRKSGDMIGHIHKLAGTYWLLAQKGTVTTFGARHT